MQIKCSSAAHKPRVAFIVHYVTDYRMPLYKELEKRENIDFTLIHSSKYIKDKAKPAIDASICNKAITVRSYEGSIGKLKFVLQPKALWLIMRSNFEFVFCQSGRSLITNSIVMLYCRLMKIPFFWWTGSWERPFNSSLIQTTLDRYQKFLWKMSHGAIVYNTAAKDKLINIGMNDKMIFIAQNTKDERVCLDNKEKWLRLAALNRQQLKIALEAKIIIFVGALTDEKRVDLLLEAFRVNNEKHADWYLIIVGDGPALDKLRDKCKVLDIRRVIFTGRIAENIYSYFFMCDVFVLPSLGGLAINDAMMCGKAVIVGSADGTEKDLIVDGITGHLLKSKDDRSLIVELADKIEQILRNKDKYTQMGEAGFEHYMKVSSFEKMVDAFEHAVFETLKGKY